MVGERNIDEKIKHYREEKIFAFWLGISVFRASSHVISQNT